MPLASSFSVGVLIIQVHPRGRTKLVLKKLMTPRMWSRCRLDAWLVLTAEGFFLYRVNAALLLLMLRSSIG
jgi:hypothetical protein